jgi:hypothetical protein
MDYLYAIFVMILIILCLGEPDILDGLIKKANAETIYIGDPIVIPIEVTVDSIVSCTEAGYCGDVENIVVEE